MFQTQSLSKMLFIILLSALLPLAASLPWTAQAGASESERAFVNRAAQVQGSKKAEAQGSILLRPSAPLPLSISAQPRTATYTYDDAGRLVRVRYGNGASITYVYDAAGNLLSQQSTAPGDLWFIYLPLAMRDYVP
jgi:YD repeat-containing protein